MLFGALMWLDLKHTVTRGRLRTLEGRADRLSELLLETRADPPAQRAIRFQAFADATGSGLMEVLRADGSRALPSPPSAASFPWPSISKNDRERFSELSFGGQEYHVLVRPLSTGSESLVLCVAGTLEGNRLVLSTFFAGLMWTIPALVALSALGGYLLSRRALRPVDEITAATRSISLSNLSDRLPVPRTGDELQRLSETCNDMLGRLESAVEEIKQFTADASHELRSPLSFVRTVAELAQRNRGADAASRRAFEEIVEECGKASRLLEDMLTLARADAGNAPLDFEVVDVAEVVTAGCEKARRLAESHGHTLTVGVKGAAHAPVWGDYASLHRLLWILLENAAKYTPAPGSIDVALNVDRDTATVTVRDNGIGISTADLPHVFQRFYRADPSRSQVEGSGLGLSIARWIAGIHRARVLVESSENGGSAFQVVFPLYEPSARAPMRVGMATAASRSL